MEQEALPRKIKYFDKLPEGNIRRKSYLILDKNTTRWEKRSGLALYLTAGSYSDFPFPVECNIICWTYLMEMVFLL